MELARNEIAVNAVVPVAATAMTRTIPAFAPLIDESERTGEPLPAWVRRDEGLGTVEDVTGLIVFLASDAARGITGQAIGVGGDRLALWAHPQEKTVAFSDGGWSASEIAAGWSSTFGADLETYGIPAPNGPGSSAPSVGPGVGSGTAPKPPAA
jgi:3-oxoacyl-[acyl-carrier protein] reductase